MDESDIFQEWLRDLDCKMSANKGKIRLIINNCTGHSIDKKSVEVQFLTPSMTSVLQPQWGIIKIFKTNYQKNNYQENDCSY